MAVVNKAGGTTAVSVSCGATNIMITLTNADHVGGSSKAEYTCTDTKTEIAANDGGDITLTLPFTDINCFKTGVDIKSVSEIRTGDISYSLITGVETPDDQRFNAACSYDFTDSTVSTVSGFTGRVLDTKDAEQVTKPSPEVKFVKKSDVTSEVTSWDFSGDTGNICLHVKIDPTDVVQDVNLREVIFSSDATFTDDGDITYVDSYCTQTSAKIHPLMEDIVAPDQTCSTLANQAPVNCAGTRVLCFKPFHFPGETTLHVQVIVTPESTVGFASDAGCQGTLIGRKKRETDVDTDDLMATTSLLFLEGGSNLGTVLTPTTCETEGYVIGLVVLTGALLITVSGAVFTFFCQYKNNDKALA